MNSTTYFPVEFKHLDPHGLACWDDCGKVFGIGDIAVEAFEGMSEGGVEIVVIVCPSCYEKRTA